MEKYIVRSSGSKSTILSSKRRFSQDKFILRMTKDGFQGLKNTLNFIKMRIHYKQKITTKIGIISI